MKWFPLLQYLSVSRACQKVSLIGKVSLIVKIICEHIWFNVTAYTRDPLDHFSLLKDILNWRTSSKALQNSSNVCPIHIINCNRVVAQLVGENSLHCRRIPPEIWNEFVVLKMNGGRHFWLRNGNGHISKPWDRIALQFSDLSIFSQQA